VSREGCYCPKHGNSIAITKNLSIGCKKSAANLLLKNLTAKGAKKQSTLLSSTAEIPKFEEF
jgi:hypothetical protein